MSAGEKMAMMVMGGTFAFIIDVAFLGYAPWGREVYRGVIDRKEVSYEEGKFASGFSGRAGGSVGTENRMSVKTSKGTLYFYDTVDEKVFIDADSSVKPNFEKDKLEFVVIDDGETSRTYHVKDSGEDTLDGKHTAAVFEKANVMYNNLRRQIHDELVSKRQGEIDAIEALKKEEHRAVEDLLK